MDDPALGPIFIQLIGGLAIFILGMSMLTQALNSLAGDRMKALLASFTRNRFAAALSGATITAVVQSSSVTTVLLVGFSSVGLISTAQSAGVIFGANVGSTFTAQIIAFKISEAGAPLLAIGLAIHLLKKYERLSQFGLFLLGLGAIFFGMQEMGDATRPLRSYPPFMEAMQGFDAPLLGILVGLVFTAVVQSSAASIGLTIVFASQGLLTLESAIAIAFGSNIGTCITAALAAIGRPIAAWRIVFIHVIFNVLGVAIWYAFIPQLAQLSAAAAMLGSQQGTIAREIAMAHTLFNCINLILFIGFTGPISKLASRLAPDRQQSVDDEAKPIYLDAYFLNTPSMAIDRARLEAGRLASYAVRLSEEVPIAATTGSLSELNALSTRDDDIDALQTAILNYLARIPAGKLSRKDQARIREIIAIVNAWENIGDALDSHVIGLGKDRIKTGLNISEETLVSIEQLHQALLEDMRLAMMVTTNRSVEQAKRLLASKASFKQLADQAEASLHDRLLGRSPDRMDLFRLESDLISNLKRIHYHVRRVAKLALAEQESLNSP
ncbi:Na/Pi cotransporter family protein [Pelagicoccus sp. SDUM812003]|uniref:Na/Pi cotransporter family protein n=1 Tax=Pelagicoccus sp. SDUM812003 TaxID=3041267 RepID=UPI00280FA243|nr:Na/Pi cotransporter family protein [Pelagicoccus sp. SDUM812003]MDQ8201379.1 Na/Pi cotransporter family protein [Pelagicoccus sp. SDUM812003]